MDYRSKVKTALLSMAAVWMLGGCGRLKIWDAREPAQLSGENMGMADGQDGGGQSGDQSGDGPKDGQGNEGTGTDTGNGTYMDIPQGQIHEQSFDVTLDGWGEVTFAAFEPEQDMFQKNGIWVYGDARFMLLKDGKAVYVFPGMFEDNGMSGQQFGQVVSVSFRDYNEDGRKDVLLVLEYAGVQGIDIGTAWMEVRAYTQEEGEKDFHLDSVVSEYVNRNVGTAWGEPITMDNVVQSLEKYADWYGEAAAANAWEVERFAGRIRREILSGDFESLAQSIAFPLVIDGNVYADKEEFLAADFVADPDKAFLEAVEQAPTQNLFHNWQGIMLGDGEVWFAGVPDNTGNSAVPLRIIAINGISGAQGEASSSTGSGQTDTEEYWQLQEQAVNERWEYYKESAYYEEIIDYWENVREVRDISNQIEFLFATDSRYYTEEDFKEEPAFVIHLAKNEIYARHGYIFEDPDLYNYFMGCIWYMPTTAAEDFDVSALNEYEKENVKVLAGLDH